jgi:hypothetical protein
MTSDLEEQISNAFLASVKLCLECASRETYSRLAKTVGKDPAQLMEIIKGKRPTKEYERRQIANFFGQPYERFLDDGRVLLDLCPMADALLMNVAAPKWLADLLPVLKSLNLSGQNAVKALVADLAGKGQTPFPPGKKSPRNPGASRS